MRITISSATVDEQCGSWLVVFIYGGRDLGEKGLRVEKLWNQNEKKKIKNKNKMRKNIKWKKNSAVEIRGGVYLEGTRFEPRLDCQKGWKKINK